MISVRVQHTLINSRNNAHHPAVHNESFIRNTSGGMSRLLPRYMPQLDKLSLDNFIFCVITT